MRVRTGAFNGLWHGGGSGISGDFAVGEAKRRGRDAVGLQRERCQGAPLDCIACLLIVLVKAGYSSPYSITEVATLIRVSALVKTPLRDLIAKPEASTIQNQNAVERDLFSTC